MDHDKLNQLLLRIEGTSVTELEYTAADWKVRLVRGQSGSGRWASGETSEVAVSTVPANNPDAINKPQHVTTAGITGTFYRAPAPGQAPFVSVGDMVHEGQSIGVVEAMKLLNTIEADCAGRVVSIFVDDGETVSPDTKLLAIEPLEASNV